MRWLPILLIPIVLSGCARFFFLPYAQLLSTPDKLGLAYEEVSFTSDDGIELFGWFLPAQGQAHGSILFLHGNAENISTHVQLVAWLPPRGFNVFIIDYRGYGASQGEPTLDGVQRDIDAAFKTLLSRQDIDEDRIVLYGQSLGGAFALYNAAHSPYRDHLRAVISDSAFSSYRSITKEKMAQLWFAWPLQWLPWLTLNNAFSPEKAIGKLSPIPVLIIHGEQDSIVPPHHAQRLYEAAREPRQHWIVPGAEHIQSMTMKEWQDRLEGYLRDVVERPGRQDQISGRGQ
jgi:uncharacterized protein